jgi:all-trans-retinol 13,14-reductase
VQGKLFISNMHPVKTLDILDTDIIKTAYKSRIKNLENSIGGFVINIVFKKDSFKYLKNNYYWHKDGHIWNMAEHTEQNWPLCYAIFCSASSKQEEYAESMTK